ncbi:hypothetical protein H7H51_07705 [Mycolicibacterium farcinogenes]|nr:hypothetical protein [Mycolicibacterium farcinogenes]
MALVTEQPDNLESTNELDKIDDPESRTTLETAEIYLSGAHVCTLVNPPSGRGRVTLIIELEVTEESVRFNDNDEEIPIRRCRRIGDMWRPGDVRPEPKPKKKTKAEEEAEAEAAAADNQPPLFDEDGEPELLGDAVDELLGEELSDAAGAEFEGGPAFSDGGE